MCGNFNRIIRSGSFVSDCGKFWSKSFARLRTVDLSHRSFSFRDVACVYHKAAVSNTDSASAHTMVLQSCGQQIVKRQDMIEDGQRRLLASQCLCHPANLAALWAIRVLCSQSICNPASPSPTTST